MVFLHVPKTGGTSFRFILENTFGLAHCHTNHIRKRVFTQDDLRFVRRFFPRLRSLAGHNLVDPTRLSLENPFYLTFLREPIARVLSHYQDGVVRGRKQETFEQALRRGEELENLHVKLMAGERNLDNAKRFLERCDFVGLTEKFDLSLHLLQRLAPCPLNLHYKRKVVAKGNSVRNAVAADPRLMELAGQFNQLDLELYAFAVNEVFPRLCQRAGLDPNAPVTTFETYQTELHFTYALGRFYNRIFRQFSKIGL